MRRAPPSSRRTLLAGLVLLLGTAADDVRAAPPDDASRDPVVRLASPDAQVRARAAAQIGKMEDAPPRALAALRGARLDPEGLVQEAALAALAALAGRHPELTGDLVDALGDREVSHRRTAAAALARLEPAPLATRVEAIVERLDPREADVVATLAPALLRFEPSVPQVLPLLVRSWRATRLDALEPMILATGQLAVPHLAAVLDDPDPRGREAAIRLLGRVPVDALVREAQRLVPILVRRLPTEPPRFSAVDAFALLILLGPEVPESREAEVAAAATWLGSFGAPSSFGGGEDALRAAQTLARGRVESMRLLLQVVVRWWRESDPVPPNSWRPWDAWLATLLRDVPDPGPEVATMLERADDAQLRTIVGTLAGTPNGEPVVRLVLASPDPARRRLAIQAYASVAAPSAETRLDLLRFLREPDEDVREAVLGVFFAARYRAPGWQPVPDPLWRSLSDVERVAVLDVLRQWIEGPDARRRMLALARVAELAHEARPVGPALVEVVRRTDVRAPEWWAISEAITRTGTWDLARPILLQWRDSPDPWIRAAGITGLASCRGDDPARLVAQTRALLESEDPLIRALGAGAATALGPDAAPLEPWFLERAAAPDPDDASAAVYVLMRMGSRSDRVFDALVGILHRPEPGPAAAAAQALAAFGPRAVPPLAAVAGKPGSERALMTLGDMSRTIPEARQAIESLVSSPNVEVSRYAKSVLRALPPPGPGGGR